MSVMRFERPVMQALDLFHAGFKIGVSATGPRKKKIKSLIGLFIAVALWSAPAFAQERHERNEVGLQIGGIVTPSQGLAQGASLIGPGGTTLPTQDLPFNSSLTLGADHDRAVFQTQKFALDGGIAFLASPPDVNLSSIPHITLRHHPFVFLT